jgi:hypothetical protein
VIERIAGPAIAGLMSLPTVLYFSLAVRVYPWKRLIDYAALHPQPFNLQEYLLALGPILILGVIGGLLVLIKRERRLVLFVAWVIAWFACIIAFQHIKQESPLRFTEMLPQVPLGFLACYLFYALYRVFIKPFRYLFIIIPALLVFVGFAQMYSSWRWQKEFLDQKISATVPLVPTGSYVMYPLKDFLSGILYFQDNTSRDTVILSETTAGNYIPVYSGNTVYIGHANTVNTEQKEPVVTEFFAGQMTPAQAKDFLTSNNLHYIFFGPQEMDDGGISDLSTVYPFLTQIYSNAQVKDYHW